MSGVPQDRAFNDVQLYLADISGEQINISGMSNRVEISKSVEATRFAVFEGKGQISSVQSTRIGIRLIYTSAADEGLRALQVWGMTEDKQPRMLTITKANAVEAIFSGNVTLQMSSGLDGSSPILAEVILEEVTSF